MAHGRVRKQREQTTLKSRRALLAKVSLDGLVHAVDQGRGEIRQLGLAQHQAQVAALCNLQAVRQRSGHISKERLHLGLALQVLLSTETFHTLGVGEQFAFGHAHTRFVRFKVVALQKLHRVRGHHRQLQCCGQCHGGAHVRLIRGQRSTLQLDVKAPREHVAQTASDGARLGVITCQQGHAQGAQVGP